MTKDEQVRAVAEEAGITSQQARMAIDAMVAVVAVGLKLEGRVAFHGLGTFEVRSRGARSMRNPSTGSMMDVPERKFVKFKASSHLKAQINGDG
jgi:DNA-binding protein HU-beta